MNKTRGDAADFARAIAERAGEFDCDIALFPPFTAMEAVRKETENSAVTLGAQNVFHEEKGAYTGEISCAMLADAGCNTVIAGHSERRRLFGDSDEIVAAKVSAVTQSGMNAIVCVGETEEQRAAGREREVVEKQITSALAGVNPERVSVAYEPVWAIGTGKNAEKGQIEDMHGHIRESLEVIFPDSSGGIRILYGGSVSPENAGSAASAKNVDGMLVGTASLELDSFVGIIVSLLD